MKLLNNEARVVMAGELKLIPGVPAEFDGDLEELKKLYPAIAKRIDSGLITTLGAAQAAAAEQKLAEMTIEKLKEYAVAKGINLDGLTKKDQIVAAIEAAGKA